MFKTACFTLAAAFAAGAAAQSTARPDPVDPKARVPVQPYESAFKDYRPYVDPKLARWRDSNQEMGRLGGHIGHVAKPSRVADPPAAAPPAHGGHGARK